MQRITTFTEIVPLLTKYVQQAVRGGTLIKDIAADTDLSAATISKIVSAETKQPRLKTVIALLRYFNMQLAVVDVPEMQNVTKLHYR